LATRTLLHRTVTLVRRARALDVLTRYPPRRYDLSCALTLVSLARHPRKHARTSPEREWCSIKPALKPVAPLRRLLIEAKLRQRRHSDSAAQSTETREQKHAGCMGDCRV
jgi:hypothetical protein